MNTSRLLAALCIPCGILAAALPAKAEEETLTLGGDGENLTDQGVITLPDPVLGCPIPILPPDFTPLGEDLQDIEAAPRVGELRIWDGDGVTTVSDDIHDQQDGRIVTLDGITGLLPYAFPYPFLPDHRRETVPVRAEQTGTGTTILTGNNTYSGGTVIRAGTLQIGDGGTTGTLGRGSVENNAALVFNRSDTLTLSNPISGSGEVRQIGAGTTILTGKNSYSGTTTISAGTLQIGNFDGWVSGWNVYIPYPIVCYADTPSPSSDLAGKDSVSMGEPSEPVIAGCMPWGYWQDGGTLGSGDVVNNATLAFNRWDYATVSNAISGSGAVNQIGEGMVTLTGRNTYTGPTTITRGGLTLTGANTGGGTLDNHGVLEMTDGASFTGAVTHHANGIMTVSGSVTTGDLTFATGSRLVLADGAAMINAGRVTLESGTTIGAASPMGFVPGSPQVVVHAAGGVTGTFSDIDQGNGFINFMPVTMLPVRPVRLIITGSDPGPNQHWVSYATENDVYLGIQNNLEALPDGSEQQEALLRTFVTVGDAAFGVNPDIQSQINHLSTLSGTDLAEALDRQSGHDRANQGAALMQRARSRSQGLQQLAFNLGAVTGDGVASGSAADQALRATALGDVQSGAVAEGAKLRVFVQAVHNTERRSQQASGVLGSHASGNTFTLGVCGPVAESWTAGASATYDMTDVTSGGGLGQSDNKTYGLDLFASHTFDDAKCWYAAANAGFGVVRSASKRFGAAPGNLTATSNGSGMETHVSAETGYKLNVWQDAVLTPYTGLSYVRNAMDATQESLPGAPGLALSYGAANTESLEMVAGANLAQSFQLQNAWTLTPGVGAALHHQLRDTRGSVSTRYAGAVGSAFNTNLGAIARDALELNASVSLRLSSRWAVGLNAKTFQSLDSDAKGHQNSFGGSVKMDF